MNKNTRSRCYFITLNDTAYEFDKEKIETILKDFSCKFYAFINHTETDNNHYHIVIRFNSGVYFSTIKQAFNNKAHIEVASNFNACCLYLIHGGQEDKKQYSINDVITNNDTYLESCINSAQLNNERLPFNPDVDIIDFIFKNNGASIAMFVKEFGADNVKRYLNLIQTLRMEYLERYKGE